MITSLNKVFIYFWVDHFMDDHRGCFVSFVSGGDCFLSNIEIA